MAEALSFILEFVLPVVTVLLVLSRISGSRQNEERYFALIGVLASKGVLDMDDLNKLKIFTPREDMFSTLVELAGGSR